jgi:hypothetical protein
MMRSSRLAISVALAASVAVAVSVVSASASTTGTGDWPMLYGGPGHTNVNRAEATLSRTTVSGLHLRGGHGPGRGRLDPRRPRWARA